LKFVLGKSGKILSFETHLIPYSLWGDKGGISVKRKKLIDKLNMKVYNS
jgi:hypothetical protein